MVGIAAAPERKLTAVQALLAGALLILPGCGEHPEAVEHSQAVARLVEENHKASEALVQAAREVAGKAGEQAQEAADAARNALDAAGESERK